MTPNTNPISVKYSDSKLRTLVEEFITMQKHEFTFKDLCSYVLYWAKESVRLPPQVFTKATSLTRLIVKESATF